MTPEVQAQLFEMFAQGSQSIERRLGGLGLGLALVKGFVELHGGKVSARSPGKGCGAEITFSLPLARDPAPTAAASPTNGSTRWPLHILVIEDSVDSARCLQMLLKRFGYQAMLAHDGAQVSTRRVPGGRTSSSATSACRRWTVSASRRR